MSDETRSDLAEWDWVVAGYRGALARFDATAEKLDQPAERFIPLVETLAWVTLIVGYPGHQGKLFRDDVVKGLKYARNRVHKELVDAIEARHEPVPPSLLTGRSGVAAPPVVLDWFWKRSDELPEPRKRTPELEKAYDDLLAGSPVRLALAHLSLLL